MDYTATMEFRSSCEIISTFEPHRRFCFYFFTLTRTYAYFYLNDRTVAEYFRDEEGQDGMFNRYIDTLMDF